MKDQDPMQLDRQARDIFLRAVELLSPEARKGYLEGACFHDPALRERVDALLRSNADDSFLEQAAVEPVATAVVAPVLFETAGALIGRYKLLERLGEGGFGSVWAAEQKEPVRRKVALKIIKLGMDTRHVVARFEAERQALALMDHPNIAKVLDAGSTETGRPYFVMELVRGIPITKFCDENRTPAKERLDLFIKICQAVQHAHQKGIIHRDLKPSNILVTLHDGVPVPKVIDFGIAKATQGELTDKTIHTQLQQFIGTPAYMSPEQAEMSGLDIDTRSDIYSLGVLLYELLTGRTPLDGQELLASGLEAMRRSIREREPVRPSTRLATLKGEELTTAARRCGTDAPKLIHLLRGDLDWIVMKCLEKDRTRRYETANGLAADLKRHLNNELVVARPPSAAYRLQKAIRRNKLAFTAGMVVAASLIVGLCVSTWLLNKEAQARREATAARHVTEKALEGEKAQRSKADQAAADLRDNLYASEMNAAYGAFWAGSLQRSRELLDRQGQADRSSRRGFDWRWLWGQTRPAEQFILPGGEEMSLDYSPDGQSFLTFNFSSLNVWDARTRRLIWTVPHGHGYRAEFSRDGRFIAAAQYNFGVRIWDASSSVLITNLLGNKQGTMWVAFSPDTRLIASVDSSGYSKIDGAILLWDVPSWRAVAELTAPGSKWILNIKFSPDGRILAAACGNGDIVLWDVASRQIKTRLTGHRDGATGIGFTPDGKRLVSGGFDRTVRLWDLTTGKEISLLGLHEKAALACAISPDGRLAATTGLDHMVKLWTLDRPGLLQTYRGHEARPWGIAFQPDGSNVVTSSADGTVRFWKVPERPGDWELDEVWAGSFGFAARNRLLLGLLCEGHIDVWDIASKKRILHAPGDNAVWVPGTERILYHQRGRRLMELDIVSGSEQLLGESGESDDQLGQIYCSTDGKLLAWCHGGDHIHVFNRESRTAVAHLKKGKQRAELIDLSADGKMLAFTGGGSEVIQLWDLAAGQDSKTLIGHKNKLRAIRFSPNGKELASVSDDHTTRLWRLDTGEGVVLRDDEGVPVTLAFSPDGQTLAVGTFESSIKLWSVPTRRQITSLEAGRSYLYSLQFSPDGSALASTSFGGKVRVWQAPSWEEIDQAERKRMTP